MRISDWSSDVCSSDLPELAPHIAPKGSITLDGVSLTVNDVNDQADGAAHFTLNIIPHTQAVTTLDEAAAGRPVNLELDVLARYLARMQQVRGEWDSQKYERKDRQSKRLNTSH